MYSYCQVWISMHGSLPKNRVSSSVILYSMVSRNITKLYSSGRYLTPTTIASLYSSVHRRIYVAGHSSVNRWIYGGPQRNSKIRTRAYSLPAPLPHSASAELQFFAFALIRRHCPPPALHCRRLRPSRHRPLAIDAGRGPRAFASPSFFSILY
jgi:hypothetical protein